MCSALTVSTRSYWRVVLGIVLFTYVSLSIFVNYFEHRTEIRNEVWSNASGREKVDTVVDTFTDFQLFDPSNPQHLIDLDKRLNQNYYVGLAARRIETGPGGLSERGITLGRIVRTGSQNFLAGEAGVWR